MNHYYIKNYGLREFFNELFNKVALHTLIISIIILSNLWNRESNLESNIKLLLVIVIFSTISDLAIHLIMGYMWGHKSMYELNVVTDLKLKNNSKVNLIQLKQASWQPRIVGILERMIMIAGFIIGRYEFVGGWLALKVIRINSNSYKRKSNNNSLWRVTENMFLIGTALSLITSFIGAEIYKNISNNNLYYKLNENRKTNNLYIHTTNEITIGR